MIPRVFHQIWLGEKELPGDYRALQDTWRGHHPEWELKTWTEADLPPGLRPEIYELLRQPAERADMLRLELLHREGGVYVDVDIECLKPIDELLEGVECFLGLLDSGRVSNAIVGGVPGHELFARALAELRPRTTYGPVDRDGTGPLLLERVRKQVDGITLFEPNVFYATTPGSAQYAFHLSARSWKDADQLRNDLARAERARAQAQDELARLRGERRSGVRETLRRLLRR